MAKKPTKSKTATKVVAKKEPAVQTGTIATPVPVTPANKSLNQSKWTKIGLLTGLVVILVAAGFWLAKNVMIVAMVNGQPLSRLAVIQELENAYGKEVVSRLITETLIEQTAAKQNITVDPAAVDAELATISASLSQQGRDLDQVLLAENMTREDLVSQIKLRLIVNQLAQSDQIDISKEEIDQYVKDNASFLPENLSAAELSLEAEKQLKESKASQKVQEWLQELQTSADIEYLIDY